MQVLRRLKVVVMLATLALSLARLAIAEDSAAAAINEAMQQQVKAWNRGDVESFMHGYQDSPETTFIGKSVEHGYAMILARYKAAYPNQDAMGKLEFSNITVRNLGAEHAVVTGSFHLSRTVAGGGDARGIFSLVWEKTPQGWKTILDHTSATE